VCCHIDDPTEDRFVRDDEARFPLLGDKDPLDDPSLWYRPGAH